MNRKMQRLINMLLLPLLFAVLLIPKQVFAEGYSCTASIPVEVQVSGKNIPSGTEYKVVLEAVTEKAPMPEMSTLTIKDGGKAEFGPITYTVPGDYQYKVSQQTAETKNFTFDKASYTVTVRVVNDENGGLKTEVWAVREGSRDKADTIKFDNQYKAPSKHHHSSENSDPAVTVSQTVSSLLSPKTGDSANPVLWMSLAAGCVLVLIILAVMRRRSREDN